jgi:hypothetical protein
MKAPAGRRKKRHEHAQQQAQQRHPNKAGPIRDVTAPRTAPTPAIYLPSLHAPLSLSVFPEKKKKTGDPEKKIS